MQFRYVILAGLVTSLFGCTPPLQVGPRSEYERIPTPVFTAYDPDEPNMTGTYTDIKVYEQREDCEAPYCPLAWHVVTNPKQSPTTFQYRGSPSFGSLTLVGAKELKPGSSYELVLTDKSITGERLMGSFKFTVNERGKIVPIAEED